MKIKIICTGMLLLTVLAVRGASTNDLAGALRNGLFEEQVDHNLEAAIATYQSVVTKFDTDRQLAATAAFRLGECYRTLGKTNEAVVQYERVVKDFADQTTLVKLSVQDLVELRGARTAQVLRTGLSPEEQVIEMERARQGNVQSLLPPARQDEALKLRMAYAEKKAMLARLKEMSTADLKQQLPTITPDPLLNSQLTELSQAEQKFIKTEGIYSSNSPSFQSALGLVDDANQRVKERMAGLLAAMETQLAGMEAQIAELEKAGGAGSANLADAAPALSPDEEAKAQGVRPLMGDEGAEIRQIQSMIQNSPDLVNVVGGDDNATPLIRAARLDQLEVARFLLDHGADVNVGVEVVLPLHVAAGTGHKAMVELLLSKGAEFNKPGGTAWNDRYLRTPLDLAVWKNFRSVAEVLLEHKADPNIKGADGLSPLHRAVANQSVSMVELLLAHGAAVNVTNATGETPLDWAATNENSELVSQLIAKGADVRAKTAGGVTALHQAAKENRTNNIAILLAAGADVNARDNEGGTPLLRAAKHGSKNAIGLLLQAKADVNAALVSGDHEGWTALHFAVDGGNMEVVEMLLSQGANPDVVTKRYFEPGNGWIGGATPLGLAVGKGADMVQVLLRHKANPNLPDADGIEPVELAIRLRKADVLNTLLQNGADVNKRLQNGYTILQYAVQSDAGSHGTSMVEAVLANHPDVNALSQQGFTALSLAQSMPAHSPEIIALLRVSKALDNVPRFDAIEVSRPATKFAATIFHKGTNDWNRFSLLELIAVRYGCISAALTPEYVDMYRLQLNSSKEDPMKFPNLEQVKIQRPTEPGKEAQTIPVNVAEIIQSGDCAKDVELKWGDVVEIPETDHPIDQKWAGLADDAKQLMKNCLTRQVQLTVKGQTTNIVLKPMVGQNYQTLRNGQMVSGVPQFSLWPVINDSGMLRTSSDLTRVKVTRAAGVNGKKQVWMLDCSDPNNTPDLWLRDGDVVEVGER